MGRVPHSRPEVIAFLAEVKHYPDDPAPLLVLADWLEERDDARGTFLRVKHALRDLPRWDPRRRDPELDLQNLLAEHEDDWLSALAPHVVECRYDERGLVEVTVDALKLMQGKLQELDGTETWAWVNR